MNNPVLFTTYNHQGDSFDNTFIKIKDIKNFIYTRMNLWWKERFIYVY